MLQIWIICFCFTERFNQELNNWNVSNVTNMGYMFCGAESINQELNNWNISNLKNMGYMYGMFVNSSLTTYPEWYK